MNRFGSALRIAVQGLSATCAGNAYANQAVKTVGALGAVSIRHYVATSTKRSSGVVTTEDIEHSTGLERAELEGKAKGGDIFEEAWLDAPFGTIEKPVEVTSFFSERIVGVPDADDDCHLVWGVIKEGEPPKQLAPDGEFFVLKRLTEIPAWADDGH